MRQSKRRRIHPLEFKAKVGLESLSAVKKVNEFGQEYGDHPVLSQWRMEIQEQAKTLFGTRRAAHSDLPLRLTKEFAGRKPK